MKHKYEPLDTTSNFKEYILKMKTKDYEELEDEFCKIKKSQLNCNNINKKTELNGKMEILKSLSILALHDRYIESVLNIHNAFPVTEKVSLEQVKKAMNVLSVFMKC